MKRILHIIPSLDPCWSSKQLLLLAGGLPRGNYHLQVVALRAPAERITDLPAHVEFHTLGAHRRYDLPAWRRWIEILRRFDPDVVHAWDYEAFRWAWLAGRFLCKPQLLVTLPGDGCAESWKWRLADPRMLNRAARVIFNCGGVRQLVADSRTWSDRCGVIDTGITLRNLDKSRGPWRELLGLSGDALLIGAAGELRADRRLKDLIWAADMLKFIRDDVHFLIVGDGPHRARLERFTSQVRIEDKVHFLGRRLDWPQGLAGIDIFVSTRESTGQPLALIEAMAAGLPVVATRVSGSEELINHERDGLLVPVGDRLAIARAIQKLLENPTLRTQLGTAAREKMRERFSAAKMVQRLGQVYEGLT